MKFFWLPNLRIYSFAKIFLWKNSQLVRMVLKELLRPSDGLANRSFCRSDISMVPVKSNWIVGKKPLAFDSKLVWKSRINFHSFRKKKLWRSLWMMLYFPQGTGKTFRWPCKPIILSIWLFGGPTEVQLNSWRKPASPSWGSI